MKLELVYGVPISVDVDGMKEELKQDLKMGKEWETALRLFY